MAGTNQEILIGLVAWLAFGPAIASADTWRERPDWARIFTESGSAGAIVVIDERAAPGSQWLHAAERARTRAKAGWQVRVEPQVGWWVGWVEWRDGPVFFALNIDMPHGAKDLPKRERIAWAVLRSIGALPTNE